MISENKLDATVRELFAGIAFPESPKGLYDPLRYMIEIGGKRIRPKLCLLAYSLFKDGFSDGILESAVGLEVFHSFTLMHDDIMDRSPLRRGKPTVWKRWNEDTAILSGDVMLIDSYSRVARSANQNVMRLFAKTAAQVCEGQQLDMEFESRRDVTMAEYEQMIGLKTAVLLACSAEMGALVAGAPEAVCKALYGYGYELGMAFQVADDYLDSFGDEAVFGKPIGGDIINCKSSWLTVRAYELAGDRESFLKALEAGAATPEEKQAKIAYVKDIYTALGVDKEAAEAISEYSARAMDAVSGIGLDGASIEMLGHFVANLTGRVK